LDHGAVTLEAGITLSDDVVEYRQHCWQIGTSLIADRVSL